MGKGTWNLVGAAFAALFLALLASGCGDDSQRPSCELSKRELPRAVLLDTYDYTRDPELTALDGIVVVLDRYDDGHPRQLGISIEPTADTFWRIDGREYVWLADGVLARQLEEHVGREVRVHGVLREGHSLLRAIDLRSYELGDEVVVVPEPESVIVDEYVEGTVVVLERHEDGHPRVLGIERDGCDPLVLAESNKSRELLYRIGRRMRVDGVSLDGEGFIIVSYAELEGSPPVRAGDGFRPSFLAGGEDENGNFMGGVEIDALAAFDGKIFAGSSYRQNTQEGSPDPAPPGAQVLVLDAPDGRWRVDFEVPREEAGNAPRMIFFDVVRFETDHAGNPLDPPIEMLAAVSGNGEIYLREHGEPATWVATGIREIVQTVAGMGERPDARSVISYTDTVSGISYLFVGAGVGRAGAGGGIYRGGFDPALPGLIAWTSEREVQIPDARPNPRVMGFVEAHGSLYASVGAQLLRRRDGATPSWSEILFFPNDLPFRGDSIRRAMEIVGPPGGRSLLVGVEGLSGTVVRIDVDADDAATEEVKTRELFPESTYTIVGYDGAEIRTLDDDGEAAILGLEMNRVRMEDQPEATDFDLGRVYEFTDGLFLWRGPDGRYRLNRVVPRLEVPPPLVAPRTILAQSPFPGEEDALYFGGFDHNGHLFHNTGWIFKAHVDDVGGGGIPLHTEGGPGTDWERTEDREPCSSFVSSRQPFFGELHIHTTFSADAAVAGTLASPRDAYQFAKSEPLGIAPFDSQGRPDRIARLERPLDFAAVTDHAESFGDFPPDSSDTLRTCFREGAIVDDSECDPAMVWTEMQEAAEEHYDRSSSCTFTTFVAYEWTGRGRRPERRRGALHRNVIFRNAEVPPAALTADTAPAPEDLWADLTDQCLDANIACDVLTIPHNSNLSRGYMFDPLNLAGSAFTAESARTRAAFEPIVEIMQSKGDSECRPGLGNVDELCGFEKIHRTGSTFQPSDPNQEFHPLSFVRNGLKEGLVIEESTGVNPFALGFVAATDGHTAAAGSVNEADFPIAGNFGIVDATPAGLLTREPPGGIEVNGGGLAVLWAEENSRDALFAAMRRRETYATSGPRMIVRFFGGEYPDSLCDDPNFAQEAYRSGVPMGGTLSREAFADAPSFAVLALRDPGTIDSPGVDLQRVQIIKGWLDASGNAQEKVFDVAGNPGNGASVDPETCIPEGPGFASLCTVWSDPEFDASERAFYYARVLENPTCRWHSYVCNELGVRCSDPKTIPDEYANCCDPLYPRTIQERAWTSPIFYSPPPASM